MVACNQPGVQRLGKRQVSGVVGGHAMPKLPDAFEQRKMRVSSERKVNENTKRLSAAVGGDQARSLVATENLDHLEIDQVRSV